MKLNRWFYQKLQEYGLSSVTPSQAAGGYVMALVILASLAYFFLLPDYERFLAASREYNNLSILTTADINSLSDTASQQAALNTARQNLADKQGQYLQTQVDTEIMGEVIDLLQGNALVPMSVFLNEVEEPEGSPFVLFQVQIETVGSLEGLKEFMAQIYQSDAYEVTYANMRRTELFNDPLTCNFNADITLTVYTVVPPAEGGETA